MEPRRLSVLSPVQSRLTGLNERTGAGHWALRLTRALFWLVTVVFAVWACGALYFDFSVATSWVTAGFALLLIGLIIWVHGLWAKAISICLASLLVLGWWLTLSPRSDRNWQPDVAQTAWADIKGDEVTLHNVRNCDYRTDTDYTPRWETRTVRLSQLTGIDLAICYWGSPYMAHPIASFQFADAPPVCFSIETRKEIGEKYSAIGGFYRRFELMYIAADERDVIRLRSTFRKGEDVFLYRLKATPEKARERFMDYLTTLNKLRDHPRWYNAATSNCTTAIRAQHDPAKRLPWDWRMLVNGKGDEMMYERGAFTTDGLPFPELRARARINDTPRDESPEADFSKRIRLNRPGFDGVPVPVPTS